jgi:beta-1,2-mannobiose phosphorylase / 1,2-beta-oligomannan phosphorylase
MMSASHRSVSLVRAVLSVAATHILLLALAHPVFAQATATKERTVAATAEFPSELVNWSPRPGNPIFTAEGPGHWDVKIRERGWILPDGDTYKLWFTGYDGTRDGIKLLGYATSRDGLHWTRWPKNPIYRDHWVEDMMVIHHGDTYYMFAEGANDNHAELLTSKNGINWKWEGELDVRLADGRRPAEKPCGTPTIWIENGVWYLFYERNDKGVWLAKTKDPLSRIWTNVRDEPVLSPGPAEYDTDMIAVNQVIKYGGAYFAFYHGSGTAMPRTWNTNVARSTDLVHWKKYSHNPIVDDNKSSGIVLPIGQSFRLYTMHDQIDVFESRLRAPR